MIERPVRTPLWSLRILGVLSIAVPMFIYAALGIFRYVDATDGAGKRVSRSLRVDAITALGFEVLPKPCSADVLSAAIARVAS